MTRIVPLAAAALTALLAACTGAPRADDATKPAAVIVRTAYGLPHISAPDLETLAYGVAYAHAQDNVCLTADELVTARGERSRWFGPQAMAQLGRRMLPNEVIDFYVAAHMDDARFAANWARTSADTQAMARGYVAGYNRYLADRAGKLPAACADKAWVRPMTLAEYYRLNDIIIDQASLEALADAMVGAEPPTKPAASADVDLDVAAQEARTLGLVDPPIGSNAWAFGKDTTGTGRGLLLGNPHFPWSGVDRFWQMHLTVPGKLDVMGAGIGHGAVVQIGFNKDVAWSHTVSTGKRFTLHELALVAGEPTSYLVDGQPEKMRAQTVSIASRDAAGQPVTRSRTLWSTRWGPVIAAPRLGLAWSAERAYALQDVNADNVRANDAWLAFDQATSVRDMERAMRGLGIPWVNTIAADRHGQAMYADVSAVPDVDAARLARCAPSKPAAALLGAAGIVVLDGSRSECDWQRDAASPVPGTTPIERMPVAFRTDWVHNSNDSYLYTHPQQTFPATISPLVGTDAISRPRTRAGLIEIPELVARGPVTLRAVQEALFADRNTMARFILPDLLAACDAGAPNADAADGCKALAGWDRTNRLEARGAHVFREFWRSALAIPGVYRQPFNKVQPVITPAGLKMSDPAVATKVWEALTQAVVKIRAAGIALDAPLGSVQRPLITDEPIALHGGEEIEGVLNNLGSQFAPGATKQGWRIDYGTSYVQTVTFDERGPLAQAILTYGQSTDPASPQATDQLRLYSRGEWPTLPFHPEDVARAQVGERVVLRRP